MIDIEIDDSSGFCFGVINAIQHAERELEEHGTLHCLGDIVHNSQEVSRLSMKGLQTISYEDLGNLTRKRVLFRAHGEPPQIYQYARQQGIEIVDATCPVVLGLQRKIKRRYEATRQDRAQIVIIGKLGHAEVNGLVGQTNGEAFVVQSVGELDALDMDRPIVLFSQTTMSRDLYEEIVSHISSKIAPTAYFEHYDTICRQVSNRLPDIARFASRKDWVYFIAGAKSSNGRVLFNQCLDANPHTTFISSADEITSPLPSWVCSVGICGATSTPKWLMEEVAQKVRELNL